MRARLCQGGSVLRMLRTYLNGASANGAPLADAAGATAGLMDDAAYQAYVAGL